MGVGRVPIFTTRCPWSVALKDAETGKALRTYWLVKELGIYPPGRQDPRLLDAFAVIASEQNAIRTEEMERATSG